MVQKTSIQTKIVTVILLTSGMVLMLTFAAYFLYEYYSFKRTTVYQLSLMSRMLGENSTQSILSNDRQGATQILSSLEVEPHILAGAIYDENNAMVAEYHHGSSEVSLPKFFNGNDGFNVEGSLVLGSQPVLKDGKHIGSVYLVSDMTAVFDRFLLYTNIAGLIFILSIVAAYFVSKRLQRSLSNPIVDLAETAKLISSNRNYAIRAKKYDNDEVGMLTDAFNQMLERIELQNQEIVNFTHSLEQKVKARTIELENAYEELEAFSYTVSHDLSAPLRHIDAFMSEFLEENETKLDGDNKKLVTNSIRYARKMRQLIDDLLAFSQLSKKELVKSETSMKELVQSVLQDINPEASDRICIDLADLPNCHCDKTTMHQVWENLLSNAIKYSRKKEKAQIQVGFKKSNGMITYFVKDNGAGFDMRSYNKLFNAFQRLHPQSQFEGTGVGLAIVQRIIAKHQGKVWAESAVDEGSTFYFSLPGE
ncbi:MAG TPA: ATP-binding protein [Chryseosolibacter sp.]